MSTRTKLRQLAKLQLCELTSLHRSRDRWRRRALAAEAECARLGAEAETLREQVADARFHPMGDNHHNAFVCPYCNPEKLDPLAMRDEIRELRRQLADARDRDGVPVLAYDEEG